MIVYIVKVETENKYKIGYTRKKLEERIKALQTGCPDNIIPIYEFESNYATKLESFLHRGYKQSRISGEWFDLTEEDLESIKKSCELFESNMETLTKHDNPFIHKY